MNRIKDGEISPGFLYDACIYLYILPLFIALVTYYLVLILLEGLLELTLLGWLVEMLIGFLIC